MIGLGGGYLIAGNRPAASHVMPDESSISNTMSDMTSGLQGKTGDDFDKAFIQEMIIHHEGAVAMAQQALQQARHSEIKVMAQDIIDAQTREITTMRGWLRSWYGIQQ
jgi:uncharacterized protein (DUF305 family)